MEAKGKAIRKVLMCLTMCAGFANPAFAKDKAVHVDVIDGSTSFIVDQTKNEAWWVADNCKTRLPLKKSQSDSSTNPTPLISEVLTENVRMGSSQIKLRQQFRFNLSAQPARIDVYNSVRGGWFSIPVEVRGTCDAGMECRSRAALPQC